MQCAMKATPLSMTASVTMIKQTTAMFCGEVLKCRKDIEIALMNQPPDISQCLIEAGYQGSVPNCLNSRINNVITYFAVKYPSSKPSWELGSRLYKMLVTKLITGLSHPVNSI